MRWGLSTLPSDASDDGARRLAAGVGASVAGVRRHGKRLGIEFNRGEAWLAHLGMTGQFVWAAEAPRFARLGVEVAEGTVWFVDARRFGCFALVDPAELGAALAHGHGPDGLDADPEAWASALRGRRAVKVALMDQAVVAGVGNIHAVEILWRLGLHPDTACDTLDPATRRRIADETRRELAEVVAEIDGTKMVYVNQGGENPFRVYQREGEPCPRCGAAILAGRHAGRATFWCPGCQVEGGRPKVARERGAVT